MFCKIIVAGRIGNKPELKTSKKGKDYCRFSLAVDLGYGADKTTTWYHVTLFGPTAKSCVTYLDKGSLVIVSGELVASEYKAKDGTPKLGLEITADSVKFLPKNTHSQQSAPQSQGGNQIFQPQADDDAFFDGDTNIPF